MKLKKKVAEIFFTMDCLGKKRINSATYQYYTYCRTRSKASSWASQWLPAYAGKKLSLGIRDILNHSTFWVPLSITSKAW